MMEAVDGVVVTFTLKRIGKKDYTSRGYNLSFFKSLKIQRE